MFSNGQNTKRMCMAAIVKAVKDDGPIKRQKLEARIETDIGLSGEKATDYVDTLITAGYLRLGRNGKVHFEKPISVGDDDEGDEDDGPQG